MRKTLKVLLLISSSLIPIFTYAVQPTTVKYCVDPDWAPYESIVDQKHVGISKVFVDLIAAKSQINFILVPTTSWGQTLRYTQTGQCDLIPLLNASAEREKFLSFSDEYFRAPNAIYAHFNKPIIGSLSGLTNQTVAVVSNYRLHHYLKNNYPNINIVAVKTGLVGLKKIDNKEVDYFVGSFHAANRIIEENNFSDIRIAGITNLEDYFRIGVSKGNEHLLPIFNSAIKQITPEERKGISSYLRSIKVIKSPDYTHLMQAGLVFIIILIVLSIRYFQSTKYARMLAEKNNVLEKLHSELDHKNKQLTDLAMKDPLTGLYNRTHLSTIIDQQIKLISRYQTNVCMLMIDIDDFKLINDNNGHIVGDDILKRISAILCKLARETDIISRWGGEEFVVICPETTLTSALQLAERFQKAMASITIEDIDGITCSIGIAELEKNITAKEWFKRADKAMYQAKSSGKNCIQLVELTEY